jgi:addiction module HigA family antidote
VNTQIAILKGIHPGIILERELKQRNLSKGRFAMSINEYPQTLGAITNGKRDMNTSLALRIEDALGIEEGFLMTLQVFYDIKEEKRKQHQTKRPDISKLRPILFWDTQIEKIDWIQQKAAIIKRIFSRGNEEEQAEIRRFYGTDTINEVLNDAKTDQQ